MKSADYKILLDLHATSAPVALNVSQNDSGRRICVSLTERGKPYEIGAECEAIFSGVKPDETVVWNGCDIENNTIIYEITPQTVAAVGMMPVQIRLYGEDGKLITSPDFMLLVNAPLVDDDVVIEDSRNEINALTKLIAEVIELKADLTGNVEDIVRRIIAEDPPRDGITPHIGENGNWFIGEIDTGKTSRGNTGPQGPKGEKGDTGRPGDDSVLTETSAIQLISGLLMGTQSCTPKHWLNVYALANLLAHGSDADVELCAVNCTATNSSCHCGRVVARGAGLIVEFEVLPGYTLRSATVKMGEQEIVIDEWDKYGVHNSSWTEFCLSEDPGYFAHWFKIFEVTDDVEITLVAE